MERFIPLELLSYFWLFENHFSKPNFIYFQGYLWGLLLARGRKTTNNIAHCCFWVERSMSALGTLSGGKSLGCQSSHENSSDLATGKTRNATSSSWRISGGSRYFMVNKLSLKPLNEKFLFAVLSIKLRSLWCKVSPNRLSFCQLT